MKRRMDTSGVTALLVGCLLAGAFVAWLIRSLAWFGKEAERRAQTPVETDDDDSGLGEHDDADEPEAHLPTWRDLDVDEQQRALLEYIRRYEFDRAWLKVE